MRQDISQALDEWLGQGEVSIGQIVILSFEAGFDLRHREDRACPDLATHTCPEAARVIANFDDVGLYRPLKTAPTLAHGWRLILRETTELRRALDYFYPAMVGVAVSYTAGALPPVPLRDTLGRQTGMYRVTQKISDADAETTVDRFCAGCLKHRLWEIDGLNPAKPPSAAGEWPLLCHEACNLLVAEIRKVVKQQG
jgi:sirohydrochlorin cobaltochelatase